LIDPAYDLLGASGTAPLDKGKGVGLPPDWLAINRQTGQLMPPGISGYTTNYSFDAMRTPWRVALDYKWYKDSKAATYLKNSYTLLQQEYEKTHTLGSSYSHDGVRLTPAEDPAMYATSLGY